jgi:DNA-binding LacI/PurR family transcriptional regulator
MSDLRSRRLAAQAALSAIAVPAGVSIGTLSRAERGQRRLSPDAARRVEETIDRLAAEQRQVALERAVGAAALAALKAAGSPEDDREPATAGSPR